MASIVLLLTVVLSLILAGAVVGALWVLGRRRNVSDTGACGKCGYSTRGLTSFVCPECGCDLRDVGIVPPQSKGIGRGGAIVLVVVGLLMLFVCGGLFLTPMSLAPAPVVTVVPAPTARSPTPAPAEAVDGAAEPADDAAPIAE